MQRRTNCPLCHSSEIPADRTVRAHQLLRCARCRLVFLAEVPTYADLQEDLAWEKTFTASKEHKRGLFNRIDQATRWRLALGKRSDAMLEAPFAGHPGTVLDIGCGGRCKLPHAVQPHGIEISRTLAAQAAPAFEARGGSVFIGSALAGLHHFAGMSFDAIVMRSFLEHETEPRAVLAAVHAALKPGGGALVRVPDHGSINRRLMGARWCGYRFPDHVNYFDRASLDFAAADLGFTLRILNRYRLFDDSIIVSLTKPGAEPATAAAAA